MSTLEELKKAAEQAKQQAELKRQKNEEQVAQFRHDVRPRMKQTFHYFKELTDTLNILNQDIQRDIIFSNGDVMPGLKQENYLISTSPDDSYSQVTLTFRCRGAQSITQDITAPSSVRHEKDRLFSLDFKYQLTEHRNDKGDLLSGHFVIHPDVLCALRFKVNYESELIEMVLRNMGQVGDRIVELEPADLEETLFDELVKHILNQPSRFDIKQQLEMDAASRERLRQQAEEIRQARLEQGNGDTGLLSGLFKK